LDESRIQYYLSHADEVKDLLVYENPSDGERILVNGHHRVESARRLGWAHIDAELQVGTRAQALMYRDLDRKPWSEIERET
jgi:DNA-binding IclR family transcriptional regulator